MKLEEGTPRSRQPQTETSGRNHLQPSLNVIAKTCTQPISKSHKKEKIQAKFELSIALTLSTWPALSLAVQNGWGGPNSSEKRDWFAGAISELLETTPDADVEYLEEFLLQVMNDEFDANLEDGSAEEIAARVVGFRKLTAQGDFKMVDEMYARWQERQRKGGGEVRMKFVEGNEDEDDTDWDSNEEEWNGIEEDTEMEEAPELAKVHKERPPPEVDEEGFTKVTGKKKR
ncbi:rRNA accumulation- protein [Trapelia coarctata]|nr:rRNA accumulation- protein [Trapelia coarctata]